MFRYIELDLWGNHSEELTKTPRTTLEVRLVSADNPSIWYIMEDCSYNHTLRKQETRETIVTLDQIDSKLWVTYEYFDRSGPDMWVLVTFHELSWSQIARKMLRI